MLFAQTDRVIFSSGRLNPVIPIQMSAFLHRDESYFAWDTFVDNIKYYEYMLGRTEVFGTFKVINDHPFQLSQRGLCFSCFIICGSLLLRHQPWFKKTRSILLCLGELVKIASVGTLLYAEITR